MAVKTIVVDHERFHIINGTKIQCSGTQDCGHCAQAHTEAIEEWVKLHNPICIICDEKPPCYSCLREKCKDWCKDEGFISEMGTHHGCRKSFHRTYCEDFTCKHGFLGWWEPGWYDAFEKRGKAIEMNLLKKFRKKGKNNGNTKPDKKAVPKKSPINHKS